MKKPLKVTLISLGTVVALIGGTLATTSIVNAVQGPKELANLAPYGELVDVEGKQMNVAVFGSGEQTIVLTPGAGTASPVADFAPVIEGLMDEYRVIAVEPFGYGLSDQADTPRTTENIVREIHAAVSSVGAEEYILMGHSITGIYGLSYANTYPDEVTAFVGIDTSLPEQPGMDEVPGIIKAGPTLRALGLLRVVNAVVGDPLEGNPAYSDEDRERLRVLSMRNTLAPTYVDEVNHLGENFSAAAGTTFPKELPLLLMYQAKNPDFPTWNAMHEAQAATVDYAVTREIDADHYLHHTKSDEVVAATKEFLAELPATA
ncbi:alpha/beta fold hydrolase [Leucobacter komagatae]|uniref:Alpha/beta hydrolase n=1 Tax=Leucobacter komagatae TaxID=55969 RepID=A0A0D0HZV9_9MICO|nr:alpha/beta hydrolase [Leucobacter komagatae]KIP53111.1 alpha/beta hydrolase [Leucobacter komagatae]